MPAWPGTLPTAPEGPGYQEQAPNVSIRTEMDAGPPKLRRRYTAGIRTFTFSWLLSKTQVATLDTFFVTTLQGGSLSFDGLNHPRTGAATTWRFVAPPTYSYLGPDAWRCQTQVEVLP
jgi:hypothetical protein